MSKKRTILDHDPNYPVDGKEDADAGDSNKDGKYFCQGYEYSSSLGISWTRK